MYVSDIVVSIPAILIIVVLIINRIKPLPHIKINLVLVVLAVLLYLGRAFLPHVLQLPINTFDITYHNITYRNIQSLDGTGRHPIEDHQGKSFYLQGFVSKKMFYDKNKDFYVLMDGVIFTPFSVKKTFHFNLTWAKADLMINSKIIKEIDRTQSYDYTFSPGFHHVSIKVYNTDVTPTKMFVSMTKYEPIISDENITKALKPYLQAGMHLNYAFGYGRKTVYLGSSSHPSIAFLKESSGGAVSWKLTNCEDAHLKAIVYSGVGTTIETDCKKVMILRAKELPEITKLPKLSECHDSSPLGFICRNGPKKFLRLNEKIKQYTGMQLTGFTPSQQSANLILPEIDLNRKKYDEIAEISRKIQEAKLNAQKRRKDPFYAYKKSSWSKILKVKDDQIPLGGFRAFYMNSRRANKVIYSEKVSRVSILYSQKQKFHYITPDHFVALWIGDFRFDKETDKVLTLAMSWAKVKLIIDGKVVYSGGNSQSIPYTFSKGKHRIEIEYKNNYGQVDFLFDMLDPVKEIDRTFKTLIKPNTKVYLVGLYDGWREDHALDLWLKSSKSPVVLFVASYAAIKWNIKNAKNLQTVVFNSYRPGSSITTGNPKVKVFRDRRLSDTSRLMPFCYDGPVVHCEDRNDFQNAINHIEKLTGKKPDGFSSIEIPSLSTKRLVRLDNREDILVPQITLDAKMYGKIDKAMEKLKR
ncbi:MAG: hypothetical protein R3331_11980 [Sulfurospirillaceae bacterium]|nr:hypothetical protein [Sulfurospirillaceae bacterium]